MLNKLLISLFILINFLPNLYANEKSLIINRLIDTRNIIFSFEQLTNKKKEIGECIMVFDNKLKCNYEDSMQKEVLINGKTLVVNQKRYNKVYFYSISNTPFINILNKKNLISLIQKSNYKNKNKNNIELTFVNKDNKKITIFFEKKNYNLNGWKVSDQLQNEILFSIKIKSVNKVSSGPCIFGLTI